VRPSFDLDDPSKEIGRLKEPSLHEKMNGKDMYPMWFILAVRLFTTTILPMPYPTIPLLWGRGYARMLDALKEVNDDLKSSLFY
jgi:hypothetical protein